jgi:hypothetical protein
MQDPDPELAVGRACSILEATLPSFDSVGFEATAYEDFYNALYVLIRDITNPDVGKKVTPNRLLEAFQDYEGGFFKSAVLENLCTHYNLHN